MKKQYQVGFTSGVFDLFHIGHLNIIKRAKKYNINETNKENTLFVGVSTDKLNYENWVNVIYSSKVT